MEIPLYQADAFTSKVFGGNPAAVCILESWLDDKTLQNIALENGLSETSFLVKKDNLYELRWFTPAVEIDLCGHGTLAAAFVVLSFIDKDAVKIDFETKSGQLTVEKNNGLLSMDLPSRKPVKIDMIDILTDALGIAPKELYGSRDLLAVYENEKQVKDIRPDFEKLKIIKDYFAVIVSAPGISVDFVSRFFAPNAGIPEDPVTGSAHCTLIPFWSERLGKTELKALQLSPRGGELFCEDLEDRVKISGNAVLYSKGVLYL